MSSRDLNGVRPINDMKRLFSPRSVAVVGASPNNPAAVEAITNLNAFHGEVYLVNPGYREVLGRQCYASLGDLPKTPDVVLVAVGQQRAVRVVEEASALGVVAGVVLSGGFAESGSDGAALQADLARAGKDMALLGPNCQGFVNFSQKSSLYLSHVDDEYSPGQVSLISQSGLITTTLLNNRAGVRWSHAITTGNEAVLDAADALAYLIDDPSTRVICMFLEVIRRPGAFLEMCDEASRRGKPIIVLKGGRSEVSRQASLSHSGSLSALFMQVEAALRRHNVVPVDSLETLLASAVLHHFSPPEDSSGVRALASSGGLINLALDLGEFSESALTPLSSQQRDKLAKLLPDWMSASNPFDYWGMPDLPTSLPEAMRVMSADPVPEALLAIGDLGRGPVMRQRQSLVLETAAAEVASGVGTVPVIIGAVPHDDAHHAVAEGLERGYAVLSGLGAGFQALDGWRRHHTARGNPHVPTTVAPEIESVAQRLMGAVPDGEMLQLSGSTALEVLRECGVAVAWHRQIHSWEECADAANTLSFPLVLKSDDTDVAHKTELGLVRTGIGDEAELRLAYDDLVAKGAKLAIVQQQVRARAEVLIGTNRDDSFGAFVLVGSGGIWAEIFNDVAIRPVGLGHGEALEMLESLRLAPVLAGARGAAPLDIKTMADIVDRVDALARALGDSLVSLDVNPVMLSDDGIVAVDALILLRQPAPAESETARTARSLSGENEHFH